MGGKPKKPKAQNKPKPGQPNEAELEEKQETPLNTEDTLTKDVAAEELEAGKEAQDETNTEEPSANQPTESELP